MNHERKHRGTGRVGTIAKGAGPAGTQGTGRRAARNEPGQLTEPLAPLPLSGAPLSDPQATPAPAESAPAPRPHRMDIERPAHDEPGSIEALPCAEPAPPGTASFIEPADDRDREATPPYLDES